MWCAITATKTMDPSSLNGLLIQNGMSIMFFWSFSESIMEIGSTYGYFVQRDASAHMANYCCVLKDVFEVGVVKLKFGACKTCNSLCTQVIPLHRMN
jgi:hypothetical protein